MRRIYRAGPDAQRGRHAWRLALLGLGAALLPPGEMPPQLSGSPSQSHLRPFWVLKTTAPPALEPRAAGGAHQTVLLWTNPGARGSSLPTFPRGPLLLRQEAGGQADEEAVPRGTQAWGHRDRPTPSWWRRVHVPSHTSTGRQSAASFGNAVCCCSRKPGHFRVSHAFLLRVDVLGGSALLLTSFPCGSHAHRERPPVHTWMTRNLEQEVLGVLSLS